MIQENTSDIKHYFVNALAKEDFVMDRSGQKTIELKASQPMSIGFRKLTTEMYQKLGKHQPISLVKLILIMVI